MTHDQIDRMVREANPVPDLTGLEPVDVSVLLLDQQRRMEMQTHDRVQVDTEQERPGRRLLIGVAAAVIVAIGALVFLQSSNESPVADETPSTTVAPEPTASAGETATAFLEAYRGSFDIGLAFSMLAPAATGLEPEADEIAMAHFLQAIGSKQILGPCKELSVGPEGTQVTCPYEFHMLRSDELGLGPYGGNVYDLVVRDGKVVSLEQSGGSNGFSDEIWVPFAVWLSENHPEDGPIMYDDWPTAHSWTTPTDESDGLWEQRSAQYVVAKATDVATGFVDALANADADAAASFLTPQALIATYGSRDSLRLRATWNEATGFQLLLGPCVAAESTASGTAVSCPYSYHGIRSAEMGLEPFSGSRYDLVVRNGKIASIEGTIVFLENGFSAQVWEPFALWISQTHPDDVGVMYANVNQTLERVTEESITVWEERSKEYVETAGQG